MKNPKGFIILLVLGILVVVVLIGAGAYIYLKSNTSNRPQNTSSIAGMSKYTDSDFGFSFWYPTIWTVQSTTTKNSYTDGTVQKTLTIAPLDNPNSYASEDITIDEFYSPNSEFTVAREGCSPMSESFVPAHRYYFDTTTHTWMVEVPAYTGNSGRGDSPYVPDSTKAADVSNNTMGGLHMLGAGCYGTVIPISAYNFIVFLFNGRDAGSYYIDLAKTISATDPAVATEVSPSEQMKTIITEGLMFGAIGTPISGGPYSGWFSYKGSIYDGTGVLLPEADAASFTQVLANGERSGFAKDYKNVYTPSNGILNEADPQTFQVIVGPDGYNSYFEKDKSHVWSLYTLIKDADPNTFAIVPDPQIPSSSFFLKDATHVWSRDGNNETVIQGADPSTFHILNQAVSSSIGFEADKNHVWYDGLLIPGANPETFIVDSRLSSDFTINMHDAYHSYQLLNALDHISTTTVKIDGGTAIPIK